jgi:hypothetical protein
MISVTNCSPNSSFSASWAIERMSIAATLAVSMLTLAIDSSCVPGRRNCS